MTSPRFLSLIFAVALSALAFGARAGSTTIDPNQPYVLGGALQGNGTPVIATLLRADTPNLDTLSLIYSTQDGPPNQQDHWGSLFMFTTASPTGTTVTLRPTAPINGVATSVFPVGNSLIFTLLSTVDIPGNPGPSLFLTGNPKSKDLGFSRRFPAGVIYGSDATALIGFPDLSSAPRPSAFGGFPVAIFVRGVCRL